MLTAFVTKVPKIKIKIRTVVSDQSRLKVGILREKAKCATVLVRFARQTDYCATVLLSPSDSARFEQN